MATLAGKAGKVVIGTSDTVTKIANWKLDISNGLIEDTSLLDSWKSSIAGIGEWKATAEGAFAAHTDTAGQTALQTAMLAGNSVTLKLYVNGSNYYSGTAFIASMGVTTAVDDRVVVSFEFTGSGAVSYS